MSGPALLYLEALFVRSSPSLPGSGFCPIQTLFIWKRLLSVPAPLYLGAAPVEDAEEGPAQDGEEDERAGQRDHESDVADKVNPLVVESCKKQQKMSGQSEYTGCGILQNNKKLADKVNPLVV